MADKSPKKDDREESSPFEGVQKSVVVHEARIFSDPQINPRQCCNVLTKILYLLIQGETFSIDIFFAVTKLFQSQNATLRRMVYLVIKELIRNEENVFVVINCLSKDMTGNVDMFRANAIRVFAKVIDASMLGTMERFLKQAIVDRVPAVASAALVTGQQLFRIAPDVVKRWQNEVQEALNSKSRMVQYHALALLHTIKQHDRLAISKVVSSLCRRPPKSPLAQCLLIRFINGLVRIDPDRNLIDFLSSCLHNRNHMVMFEAARGLCNMPNATSQHITPAIVVLTEFLNSSVPAQRFAAVRTLSQVVSQYPMFVTPCSVDLELLISDPNRGIATLAVTTLLKTGVESSVDRLMKSITGFMAEIPDELRIVIVDAIRSLCLKFPHKHVTLMNFLSSVLREEGGLEYKKAIVQAILVLMAEIEDAKEPGLGHLCEFIEDCEFPTLAVQVIDVLGTEGPTTNHPARYIRFIFNRVILEAPVVRAAAVQTLARFGAACPELTESICVLLERCLVDNNDEVRDRATYSLQLLSDAGVEGKRNLLEGMNTSWKNLEYSLGLYIQEPGESPFALDDIVEVEQTPEEAQREGDAGSRADATIAAEAEAAAIHAESVHSALLESIPEFAALGTLFKSSSLIPLTESEAEYVVTVVKHIFNEHVLLQFNITNYMQDQMLVNVTVDLETDADWVEELAVPAAQLEFEVGGVAFVCLRRPEGMYSCDPMPGTLKFSVRDADAEPDEEGYEDEYQLEEIEIGTLDFMKMHDPVSKQDFRSMWESMGNSSEIIKKFSLGMQDLQEAIDAVSELLGMRPVENCLVAADGATTHAANFCGLFAGEHTVLTRAGFIRSDSGVVLKVAVRSPASQLSEMVVSAIQ